MRLEYIGPFADSAHDVLEIYIPNIEKGDINLEESLATTGLSATITLKGSADGRTVIDLEPELAKKIAGAMNGMEFEQLDDLAIDTICELTNIIIGRAITTLNNRGFKLKTSTPAFFIGKKVLHGAESVCISLKTEFGDVKIMLALEDPQEE